MAFYQKEIEQYIDAHWQEMLDFLQKFVNLEGKTDEKERLNKVAAYLKEEFEKTGMICRLESVGEEAGDYLIGTLGADRPGKPIIFSGHFDTVIPAGAFGENPFRVEGNKVFGPGIIDMKGGIAISLFVIKALNAIGFQERPIKICYVSDEETGHAHSVGAEVIKREAAGGLCCFNMETGHLNNILCVGRKACVGMDVTITGVDAHAGNSFTSGRNAIVEMAHKIMDLQALTCLEEGTTVNCGVIAGGTVRNAVPRVCKLNVDMRFTSAANMQKVLDAAKAICEKTYIEGTTTEMRSWVTMPPFETTDSVLKFYELCSGVAKEYGYDETSAAFLGGGSDAAYFGMMGIPTICSFGLQGEHNHTAREYGLVDSLLKRSKWITAICLHLNSLENS